MRTNIDALRSLKRYVAASLGDAWEVRLSMDEGTFSRPQALIQAAGSPVNSQASRHAVDVVAPFVIYLYPESGSTHMESLINAGDAEELLFDAFHVGVGAFGRPLRIPFYDYEGKNATTAAYDTEKQRVTISGSPTGGTFTLTFDGQTTAALARNASSAQVTAALLALNNIGASDVTTTGSNGGPWTVEFSAFRGNVPQMNATSSLTGGTSPAITVQTLQTPNRGVNNSGLGSPAPHGDYLRIDPAPTVQRVQDPEDELLFTIICEVRLSWRRLGRLPSGELVQSVEIELDLD